jgi:hypothetical protein
LKITWSTTPWGEIPNEFGGKTAFYGFSISGQEAISFTCFDRLLKDIQNIHGTISCKNCVDIEDVR